MAAQRKSGYNGNADTSKKLRSKADSKAPSRTTLWRHARGRPTIRDKAAGQQYLTPGEEDAMKDILKVWRAVDHPLPPKSLLDLALVIRRQRQVNSQSPASNVNVKKPCKHWPWRFLERHPDLMSRTCQVIDSRRYENIYEKVTQWFTVIGEMLSGINIHSENVYNVDETGNLLNNPRSVKVIVNRHDRRTVKPARVQRTLVTSIECISGDGRSLPPLIIWPAATQRSNWTTHPTPGWHYACSPTGYNNSEIMLDWLRKVFDPLTKDRACGRPRVLINDGFTAHESAEVLKFCSENNIILCRLPSHTSHILQPLDVAVFGPLKTAYRDEVERLLRGGSNNVTKEHFPLLYSQSRAKALKHANIQSTWSKTGLFPFNPSKVLRDVKSDDNPHHPESKDAPAISPTDDDTLLTPITPSSLTVLGRKIDKDISALDDSGKALVKTLFKAAERAIAKGVLYDDEFIRLRKQNEEKKVRESTRATMVGDGRVMSYQDILIKQAERDSTARVVQQGNKRSNSTSSLPRSKKSRTTDERERAEREIESWGMADCCAILNFD